MADTDPKRYPRQEPWKLLPRQLDERSRALLLRLAERGDMHGRWTLRDACDYIAWLERELALARDAYDSLSSSRDAPSPPWETAEARYQAELPEDFR